MFSHDDLSTLVSAAPPVGVSIFLPTPVAGRQTRQSQIRLKNLAGEAREKLEATGLPHKDAEAHLAPATSLIHDHDFWQHQEQGLALFLDGAQAHVHKVPLELTERVVVGPGFHVRPLLPLLAADGEFRVLTITADSVRLFRASRFGLAEQDPAELPTGVGDEMDEWDYENPQQASPTARPNTGTADISHAQVYGDSPPEWRKRRLVEFTRKVAGAVDHLAARRPAPLVLVATAEIGGHFQKFSNLGPLLAGFVEANPEAMERTQLHEAAYEVVLPRLDGDRAQALDRFEALRGSGDPRAASGVEEVVPAAYQGRVDTLLLFQEAAVWGRYDQAADRVVRGESVAGPGEDLLEAAAVRTLQNGGSIHVLPHAMHEPVAAVLRY